MTPARAALVLSAALAAGAADAEGFAVTDLRTVADQVDLASFEGGAFIVQAEAPERLLVFCPDCEAFTAVDVILGKAWDDSEDRLHQGVTDFAALEATCKSNNATCTLGPISIGRALGWVTTYEPGEGAGSTNVLFLDGAMLAIRALGPSVANAAANGAAARAAIGRLIVGDAK